MIKSDSIGLLTAALIAAQNEFLPVLKTKENPAYKRENDRGVKVTSKYAGLDDALDATQPALAKNGLAVIQFPINEGDRIGVLSILTHVSGEFIYDSFTLALSKQDPQGGVAAITYARRAGYLAILGVAAEDDDGNTASNVKAAPKEQAQIKSKPLALPAGVGPEKAAIPNDLGRGTATTPSEPQSPTSNTSATLASAPDDHEVPNEDELKPFRKQHVALVELLSKNGLTSETGKPQKKKVLLYTLKTTGADSAENITKGQWRSFFQVTAAAAEADIKNLVALVEAASK